MRQVPLYGIVGRGRVARHMQQYLSLLGLAYTTWHTQSNTPPKQALAQAKIILILQQDPDIASWYARYHSDLPHAQFIHFSGRLTHAHIVGAHPLMTFSDSLYTLETYQSIPFVLEQNAPSLEVLLPGLPNQAAKLNTPDKARYHAHCVMANNFTTLLWMQFQDYLEHVGLPTEFSQPILEQTAYNLVHEEAPLTGPIARGDKVALKAHLKALENDPSQALYRAFIKQFSTEDEVIL